MWTVRTPGGSTCVYVCVSHSLSLYIYTARTYTWLYIYNVSVCLSLSVCAQASGAERDQRHAAEGPGTAAQNLPQSPQQPRYDDPTLI